MLLIFCSSVHDIDQKPLIISKTTTQTLRRSRNGLIQVLIQFLILLLLHPRLINFAHHQPMPSQSYPRGLYYTCA